MMVWRSIVLLSLALSVGVPAAGGPPDHGVSLPSPAVVIAAAAAAAAAIAATAAAGGAAALWGCCCL